MSSHKLLKLLLKRFIGKNIRKNTVVKKLANVFILIAKPYIDRGGKKFFVDANMIKLLIEPEYEKQCMDVAKQIIRKGDVVLDIGANIGIYTLLFSELVGDTGLVYAFEPEEKNFKFLLKNVKKNDLKNVVAINVAVSNEDGNGILVLSKIDEGRHYITKDKNKKGKDVKITSIDSMDLNKVDFAKIDAEGAELFILQGMKNTIRNNNVKILLELELEHLARNNVTKEMILNELKNNGYVEFKKVDGNVLCSKNQRIIYL